MFNVKKMSAEDIEFAVRITDTMNWNLTEQDFEFMMSLEPEGCFILRHNEEKAGLTTTISFGKAGWIGNVIISENCRRKGAGSTIVKHAINYLKSRGVETIGLYSYNETVDFYTRLGFKRDSEFAILNGKVFSPNVKEPNVREVGKTNMQKIVEFDHSYFGASRKKLLEKIANLNGNLCYCYIKNSEILGYAMAKVYGNAKYAEIGPLVCKRECREAAIALLKTILKRLNDFEVFVCLPRKEESLVRMFFDAGFTESFNVTRMFLGGLIFKDCIYIAESLERG